MMQDPLNTRYATIANALGIHLSRLEVEPPETLRVEACMPYFAVDKYIDLFPLSQCQHPVAVKMHLEEMQQELFRAAAEHMAKHDRSPVDRLNQIEAAATALLDALGLRGAPYGLRGPVPTAASELDRLLQAKSGAVSWRRDGYVKDPI